jgi:hypothetical protein
MRLTKHRGTFNLEMSSEDLNNLCFLLRGHQTTLQIVKDHVEAPATESILTEYLQELTRYQREAYNGHVVP